MIVLTAETTAVMLQFDWNGVAASTEAGQIDTLLDVMIVLSSFVFSVVMVMLGYSVWKYRAKPGDESDGEPIHGNTKLEIAWTVVPTIIVLFAAGYGWIVLHQIEEPAGAEANPQLRIDVTSQQFKWTFDYPEEGITSDELHVPVDRQLELRLTALDVVHSFWVPEWRIKRDLVPGAQLPEGDQIDNAVYVTPTRPGTYAVVCAELCGLGHATMRAPVVVYETVEEFEAWAAEQQEIPEVPHTGAAGGRGAGVIADPDLFPQPQD
jgi:cytochrome c oxidase subunit II